jgi:hypothetical protein
MCNVHNSPVGNYVQLEFNSQSGCISNTHVHGGLGCHTVSTASAPLIYFLFNFIPIWQRELHEKKWNHPLIFDNGQALHSRDGI